MRAEAWSAAVLVRGGLLEVRVLEVPVLEVPVLEVPVLEVPAVLGPVRASRPAGDHPGRRGVRVAGPDEEPLEPGGTRQLDPRRLEGRVPGQAGPLSFRILIVALPHGGGRRRGTDL